MKRFLKIFKYFLYTLLILAVLGTIATIIVVNQPQFGKAPNGAYLEKLSASPQHNGEIFKNAGDIEMSMGLSKMPEMLEAYQNAPSNTTPENGVEVLHPDINDIINAPDSITALTWFGHSAFLLEIDGFKILLDPMLGQHAAPFSFSVPRFNRELAISFEDLPAIDAVIFSHDHYDHLDYPTILKIKEKVKHFYVPLGLGGHLRYWGVEDDKITELDWWQSVNHEGLDIVCTPSQHFSGRGITDGAATLWSSWVIKGKKKNIFFNGDSGYFPGYKEIGEKYGPFDIALVECGQYNELWQEIHMLPEQSAQAGIDLNAKAAMPIHWGMFDLSLHSWTEPVERVSAKAKELKLPLVVPRIGQRFLVNESMPLEAWWKE